MKLTPEATLRRDRESARMGYDRRGDGEGPFKCTCEWGSRAHGDKCPEHGRVGVVIRDPFEVLLEERATLLEQKRELLDALNGALAAWLTEARWGDGIAEQHTPALAAAKAAMTKATGG